MNVYGKARYIWRAHRARWRDERAELAAAMPFCRLDGIACDIGANKGSYTYWLSKWAHRVVAFEPQPELAAYLKSVVGANVTVESKGVYSKTGVLDLHRESIGSPGASLVKELGSAISVPVTALDDYFDQDARITFLKIDVEGAEMDVFLGAQRILSTQRPAIIFECEQRHASGGDAFEVFGFLESLGYMGHFFRGREILPISRFRPEVHQGAQAPYCNNFIFVPRAAP